MKSNKTKQMIYIALFSAIEIVLMFTPLGYIPIGPIRATTLHIPVILAGILLGSNSGAVVGFVFGFSSLLINTFQPTATSFVFSPFITIGEYSGGMASLVVAFLPRILLGYFSGKIYSVLKRATHKNNLSILLSTLFNTLIHSVSVLGLIYFFFGPTYAQARQIVYDQLLWVILGIMTTNGLIEMILACILVLATCKALAPLMDWRKKDEK